ncbi:beta-carotene 15,15'-monooxygenase [Sphingobacterium anhuiense]|uniref:Beta-carotene 15,15'-monooxygenase n=1 Tax=Sphingobacterium anhuiense TaxID=493780 RepID=A0ABW5YXK1_9SPHI
MEIAISTKKWSSAESFSIRLLFIFFIILTLPYDVHLYHALRHFSFESAYQLATFRTSFIAESDYVGNHFEGFYNWLIALVIAFFGAVIWTKKRKSQEHELYYWLRVLLRYRLAFAIIASGIVKLVPVQFPAPTLSDYNTEYGDFLLWKIYYLSTAITKAGYVPGIGVLEITAGVLLVFRKTVAVGAGVLIALLANIVIVNFVYELGEQVYSLFLLLIAITLFSYDLPRFFNAVFRQVKTQPEIVNPLVSQPLKKLRVLFKGGFLLFFILFGFWTYNSWKSSNYPYPKESGIAHIRGLYNVDEFVLNSDTLAYSLTDSSRWQNVVFESWNTFSIKRKSDIKADLHKPRIIWQADSLRNFENIGNGGREFYRYTFAQVPDGRYQIRAINKRNAIQSFQFELQKSGENVLLLLGKNEQGESLQVKLRKINKEYLLDKGRRKPISIY